MYINKAIIIGNLTRDPELKALPSGGKVASLSLATNRTYKDRDGAKKEEVEYHNVVAFGTTAENIGKYMKKGSQLYVEGRLQTRSWDKDGVKQYRTEIVAETVQFGSRRDTQDTKKQDVATPEFPEEEINPEDIPF